MMPEAIMAAKFCTHNAQYCGEAPKPRTLFAMHSLGKMIHFFLKKQYVTFAEPLTKIIGSWYVG